MLRKLTGSSVFFVGLIVLLAGFYAPLHPTIYFQYLSIMDNLQEMSHSFAKEPTATTRRIADSASSILASWFAWDTERIAKFVPIIITSCSSDSLACYAQCEERLGSEAIWSEQKQQTADHLVEIAQLTWPGTGQIIVSGSSTLFPLTEQMATCYAYRTEQHGQLNADEFRIQLASVGTHGNLDQLCDGTEDLHNASDRLTQAELRAHGCSDARLSDLIELTVAKDALTIVRGRPLADGDNANLPVNLNDRQLRFLLAYADHWSEIHPTGSDKPIVRYYPSLDSGTRSVLLSHIFAASDLTNVDVFSNVNYVRPHEDDAWAARQIARNPNAIGFFGYRFYREQSVNLIALPIAGKMPEDSEEYPLMRPLYLYTTGAKIAENALLRDFLHYYLLSLDEYTQNMGYVPLNSAERKTTLRTFEALLPQTTQAP